MANLLESYKNRIRVAEKYSANKGMGQLSQQKKVLLAKVLHNTDKFLAEAFTGTTATQMSDMGSYKKFALNITNLAVPTLVAPEICMTSAMSSVSGYITYLKFTAGTTKGSVDDGDVFSDIHGLGTLDEGRINYTSASVVEAFTGDGSETQFGPLGFTQGAVLASVTVDGVAVTIDAAGTASPAAGHAALQTSGKVKFGTAPVDKKAVRIAYTYDNTSIEQTTLPVYNVERASIALVAKARRIAIRYSALAAFVSKQDYGEDIEALLPAQAVGELNYEIDSEIVTLMDAAAKAAVPSMVWNIQRPQYISKADHYEGFAEVIEAGKMVIYDRTKRFVPNFMVASSTVLRVLPFMKGWTPSGVSAMNGPFVAGTLDGIKVVISPALAEGRFFLGVNENDLRAAACGFFPYMAVVPTQLLEFADGSRTQGFATMYDAKILNDMLLVAGQITNDATYPPVSPDADTLYLG